MIEVELPDGRVVEVDTTDANVAAQAAQKFLSAKQPEQPSMLADAGKSVGAGLANAAIGTIGGLGDVRELASRGVDMAGSRLGVDLSPIKSVASAASNLVPPLALMKGAPTSQDVRSTIKDPIVSPDYESQSLTGSYLKTAAEFTPGMLAGGRGGLAARFMRNVAVPAIGSETAGQLTKGTEAEPFARVAGALLAPGIEGAARRAITPLPASADRQALAQTLRNEGVQLTAGQSSGSRPLQWMESALGDTIGSGGPAARTMEGQAEQFTSAALRRAGIDARRATPDVIDNAFTRIGNDFEAIGQRNNVIADRRLGTDLTRVEREYNNVVSPSNRAPVIANTARDIGDMMAQNGGNLTGQQYNAVTSRLARQARNAQTDPQLREALQGLRGVLDDAMERSMFRTGNSADLQLLRQARNQYRNMIVLEKAATGAGSNAAEGLISPSQLRNAVVQQGRRAYGRGQGDFAELARAGEALLKPLPQSGTSPRNNVTQLLNTLGAVVGGGAGSAAGPAGTALGALAGLAAPAVAGRALLSRPVQAYLGNQALQPQPGGNSMRDAIRNLLLSGNSAKPLLLPSP
jgi:hypothetical protein